jgi:hypothetical protein
MSYHLLGDYDMAQSILEEFRKTQQDRPAPSPYKAYDNEHSEFIKNHSNSSAHRVEGKYLLFI